MSMALLPPLLIVNPLLPSPPQRVRSQRPDPSRCPPVLARGELRRPAADSLAGPKRFLSRGVSDVFMCSVGSLAVCPRDRPWPGLSSRLRDGPGAGQGGAQTPGGLHRLDDGGVR